LKFYAVFGKNMFGSGTKGSLNGSEIAKLALSVRKLEK
jgi:hypothetical protein